jgi:flagellar biosynthesis/type III secretory pathway chaperone
MKNSLVIPAPLCFPFPVATHEAGRETHKKMHEIKITVSDAETAKIGNEMGDLLHELQGLQETNHDHGDILDSAIKELKQKLIDLLCEEMGI